MEEGCELGINSADTLFVLLSAALVMLMTPGLALFYGGLVRRKNILNVLMKCMAVLGIISLHWVAIGYSLSFSTTSLLHGFVGNLDWAFLKGVGSAPFSPYSATVPHQAFMVFQMMFAVITPALIVGSIVERMRFSSFLVFVVVWATVIYAPICHWVWAVGGWLRGMGALDFAGGTVVHIASGVSALALALVLGKRKSAKGGAPANLPMAVIGAGLLWFGWFGFNAGSALAVNGLAVNAFVVTHLAACAGAVAFFLLEWIVDKKPTILGTITGAVAGLVAITPASGFVSIKPAIIIGIVSSIICYVFIVVVKKKLGYDDTLDAFGVHGIGGIWGALATGIFASKIVNSTGANGWFYGNPSQFFTQLIAVGACVAYAFVGTIIIALVIKKLMPLRVTEKEEEVGLDLALHNETAYKLLD